MQKPLLFTPFKMRGVVAPNRCVVSPMVQYRATDGQVNDYHLVHLGKFALGKFGIVFTENCAVEPRRPRDPGRSRHVGRRPDRGPQAPGALPASRRARSPRTQITHAGRKGIVAAPVRQAGRVRAEGRGLAALAGRRPVGAVGGRALLDDAAGARRADEMRRDREEVRRGRAPRRCRGLRRDRDPRRARLPAGAVPLAAQQQAQRPVWRRPRRPHALPARGGQGGARELARAQADVHPRLGGRRRAAAGTSTTPSPTRRS